MEVEARRVKVGKLLTKYIKFDRQIDGLLLSSLMSLLLKLNYSLDLSQKP